MGQGSSQPEQHVFNADAPVRLSQSVINNLQSSPETDSTRAQDLELKVQNRVNAELARVKEAQAKQLDDLTASLTTNPPKEDSQAPEPQRATTGLAYHLSSPFYHDSSKKIEAAPQEDSGRSHDSVHKEIMDLRQKLDARKKVEKVPQEVAKAKESLVQCLRTNDRRPLDCWQEVEQFKAEVGKLEKAFIQKAGR
ncbi:MICOS complex subunit mic19 [Fulvia fulva]|uniref:MICOS complex subunit mic19 n=1 Tax=Passalora fulva TaxID=5499 RepID=A0A9Q8L7D6_PASFU|nr:MICOS complex subunit mic19 [Fulvia fulva]KAK4635659.1 MICOS complex subunit mic19 [Fulvia fulva]KAK4637190.1 MICOS complex subunit mic19 [Fulvia fulva]UJO11558.1 MICOS complex subunit mic19 [Fulvia fulva]WPV08152.1 MICOS complex subunit mic19 [Fulvia fulva]WPV23758.1 MICOS complex subunit mic19 [Fulvia fulva]